MTTDPRLPTLEQIMNGNPFELVDSPWGKIEAWRASTLATGTMGALAQVYETVRNDAAELSARADEAKARSALIQDLCSRVDGFQRRFDALVAKHEAEEAVRKAAADAAREFEEEPLSLPPGDPPEQLDAELGKRDGGAIGHTPSGELHEVAAKHEPDDNVGDLPEGLEDLPDPAPEPQGIVYPQPIAVSLNKE
jgi:hypothetical protein